MDRHQTIFASEGLFEMLWKVYILILPLSPLSLLSLSPLSLPVSLSSLSLSLSPLSPCLSLSPLCLSLSLSRLSLTHLSLHLSSSVRVHDRSQYSNQESHLVEHFIKFVSCSSGWEGEGSQRRHQAICNQGSNEGSSSERFRLLLIFRWLTRPRYLVGSCVVIV
jgi:hypothetical protein